jgi:hypothetical protein
VPEPPDQSNPSWWIPPPPLRPPKPISVSRVLLGTLLPIVAVAVVVVLVVTHKSASSTEVTGRSLSAFQACVRARGIDTSRATGANRLQSALRSCASHLPHGARLPTVSPRPRGSDAEARAYGPCMQSALANLGAGGGARGFSRTTFRNAQTMCRALAKGTGSPAQTTTGPKTA